MTTKRRFIKHLPLVLAGLALGLGVFVNTNSRSHVVAQQSDATDYYNGVTDSMTGDTLLNKLNTIINTNNVSVSYDWSRYKAADEDPNNNSNIVAVYSRRSMPKSSTDPGQEGDYWNREHTFPNSKITGKAESDNHIIYASEKKVNGTRSSLKMGVVNNGTVVNDNNGNATTCQKTSSLFDPHNVARGIVARTTMYAAAMYGLSPTDNFESVATMLRWHLEYQPDANDVRRNNTVYSNQNNRNPFVDHPEYACRIWGSTNSTTQSICNATGSVSISESSKSIEVGNTFTVSATSSDNSTISWSSDDENVATVSAANANSGTSITVEGVGAGTATITASATISGNTYSATCSVTVTSSGGGDSSNEYSLYSGTITEGDYLIVYDNKAMNTTVSSNRLQYETVSASNNKITTSNSSIIWHIAPSSSYWTLYNSAAGKFAAGTGTKSQATVKTENDDYSKWTVTGNSTYEFVNKGNSADSVNANLRANGTYGYACYATGTGGALSLYKKVESSPATLSSISVSGYNSSFSEGDEFAFGGTVTAHYSNNSTANVTSQATFSGYDMTTTGGQTVTVSFGGKTCTYQITVNKGTLSSIAVSGYTTNYSKGDTFSFDGTCTATFENGYQKEVTPSSVSSPNMTTAGSKTVTVSYTYNGTTKTTSYSITVSPSRIVLEESSVSGTITWSSQEATVSGISATVTNVENTYYESNSMRLGTGNGGGKLRIETNVNIVSVVVTAKAYSDSKKGTLTVGDKTLNVQNTDYSEFSLLTLTTPTKSLLISTASSSVRINIQSLVINCVGSVDISSSEDCLGLETFIDTYMHMEYTQNLGYCKDSTHHYYSSAKSAFNNLNTHQRSLFVGNSAYSSEFARLSAWASANGESFNSNNQLSQRSTLSISPVILEKNSSIIVLVLFTLMGASAIGAYVYSSKKKTSK